MKDAALVVSGLAGDAAAAEAACGQRCARRCHRPSDLPIRSRRRSHRRLLHRRRPNRSRHRLGAAQGGGGNAAEQAGNSWSVADEKRPRPDQSMAHHHDASRRRAHRRWRAQPTCAPRRARTSSRLGHDRPDRLRVRQRRARQRQLCNPRQAGRGRQGLPRHAHRGRRPRQPRRQRRRQSAALGQARAIRGSVSGQGGRGVRRSCSRSATVQRDQSRPTTPARTWPRTGASNSCVRPK